MSGVRVRTRGNNPETRIFCDGGDYLTGGSPCRSLPVTDWDARDARKLAKSLGWVRIDKKDYCPGCSPSANPCGHSGIVRGCGGCDPAAIDFVITDDGARRPFAPERDLQTP